MPGQRVEALRRSREHSMVCVSLNPEYETTDLKWRVSGGDGVIHLVKEVVFKVPPRTHYLDPPGFYCVCVEDATLIINNDVATVC